MAQAIHVTGLGALSPLGDELPQLWDALMGGRSGVRELHLEGIAPTPAASVRFEPSRWLDKLQQVGTERVSQMALGAARLALADAGLANFADPPRVGVYLGTGMGGASTVDAGYEALHAGRRIPPLTIPAGMVSGAAAVVAMHLGIQGPVITYSVACASSAVAIVEAAHALRRGEIDVALAGGAESLLVRGTLSAWHALQTLARPTGPDGAHSCRPFSADRDGLVLGEGAAFLVLESAAHARSRGARTHALFAGGAVRCDARHLTRPHAQGQVEAMRAALRDAGCTPSDVGYCNAHGTATTVGDPVECDALAQVWGSDLAQLQLSSTKAAHGHLLGAAGALEALITVLALAKQQVPPTANTRELDAACSGARHVLGEGVDAPRLRAAITNSFAFGGTNAALVFARAER